jgi:hypothetical protein
MAFHTTRFTSARRALSLVLLLALLLPELAARAQDTDVPATPAQAATTPLDGDFMGMVVRDPWFDFGTNPAFPGQPNKAFQDRMGATLAEMGVRWVRLDVRVAAGIGAPAELVTAEIAKNDYFINEVAPRYGFNVLGLLAFDLLQGVDANLLNSGPYTVTTKYGGGVNAYMNTWLDRALEVADRYGPNITAYQVLNEQNRLPRYLPNGPAANAIDPAVVGRLVTKLYRFCRGIEVLPEEPVHGCRDAQIVLGGIHPRGTGEPKPTESDVDYLKRIYADPSSFKGFYDKYGRWPVDGVGYHPYPEEIRLSQDKDALVDRGIGRIRGALEAAGDPCVPLWITEVGYNVGFDVDGPANPIPQQTEAGQAAFMYDVYTTLAARQLGSACGGQREIAHVFWFKYEDFPPASGPGAQRWGVVRIPFRETEECPGGACYDVNGVPELYRVSYATYRQLALRQIFLPVLFRS